jgi:hypothetical protein
MCEIGSREAGTMLIFSRNVSLDGYLAAAGMPP